MYRNIHIKNMSFKFSATASLFFENIELVLEPKRIYFVQGANGAGKSTLFRLLQAQMYAGEVLEGRLSIAGVTCDLNSDLGKELLHTLVQVVRQDYNSMLADQFNFEDNMRFAHFSCYPMLKKLPEYKAIPELMQRFNIDVHKPVHLLSGGQRQILAILMALQKQPTLLLLDEPTAALDPVNTQAVLTFLHELVALTDITIMIISHDRAMIAEYAADTYFEICNEPVTGVRTVKHHVKIGEVA